MNLKIHQIAFNVEDDPETIQKKAVELIFDEARQVIILSPLIGGREILDSIIYQAVKESIVSGWSDVKMCHIFRLRSEKYLIDRYNLLHDCRTMETKEPIPIAEAHVCGVEENLAEIIDILRSIINPSNAVSKAIELAVEAIEIGHSTFTPNEDESAVEWLQRVRSET